MYPISPGDYEKRQQQKNQQLIKYHIGCVRFMSEQEIDTKYRKYGTITV